MKTASRDLQLLFSEGTLRELSDGRLLEQFGTYREEAAFEVFVRRHGPMVWGVCRRLLGNHHDAEDAFQATFLVLARKGDAIAHRELVANWLYGVAHQTAMKARSTRAKRRMREGQVMDMPEPEAASQDHRDDLTETLDRELSRLPDKYRIPIILCELEGKSHRAAAEQLGWPIGTVSGRLSRARAMLAKRLVRQGMVVTIGSLKVLLVEESAAASMPAKLIGSTARAASLFAAGGAITVGAVPAAGRFPDRSGDQNDVDIQIEDGYGDVPGSLCARGRRNRPQLPRHGPPSLRFRKRNRTSPRNPRRRNPPSPRDTKRQEPPSLRDPRRRNPTIPPDSRSQSRPNVQDPGKNQVQKAKIDP